MNSGSPVGQRAAAAPPSSLLAQDSPHAAASGATAACRPDNRRTAGDALLEQIAQCKTGRALATPAPPIPPARTLSLIKTRLEKNFALGSPEASALAGLSQSFHAEWSDRALADKLVHALKNIPATTGARLAMDRIILKSNRLPPALQLETLKQVPDAWIAALPRAGVNMETILQRLLLANVRFDAEQQFQMLDLISETFSHPEVRRRYENREWATIDSTAMEAIFAACSNELEWLCRHRIGEIVEGTQARIRRRQQATGQTTSGDAIAPTMHANLVSYAQTMLTRGMYLIPGPQQRCGQWNTLMNNAVGNGLTNQNVLLPALIACIPDLARQSDRHDAFNRVLSAIETLAPAEHLPYLQHTAGRLQCMTDADFNVRLHARLEEIAHRIAPPHKAAALALVAGTLHQQPVERRRVVFNRIVARTSALPAGEQAPALHALGMHLPALALEHRSTAYDGVCKAIGKLPVAQRPAPAAALYGAIPQLPPYERRHLPFIEAVNFIGDQPVALRQPMILALREGIWSQAEDAMQVQCLDSTLSLLRTLPLEQAFVCLQYLYESNLSDDSDTFKFCVQSRLLDEVGQFPHAAQPALLGHAARQALFIDTPYCGPMFARIARSLQAVPQPAHAAAMHAIATELMGVIARFDFSELHPPVLPDYFCPVLEASERLPDDLRIAVLIGMKQSVDRCPDVLKPRARKLIADRVNDLPITLLARMAAYTNQ